MENQDWEKKFDIDFGSEGFNSYFPASEIKDFIRTHKAQWDREAQQRWYTNGVRDGSQAIISTMNLGNKKPKS